MKKVAAVAGKVGTQMRDRSRAAKLKVLAIARASRNKTEQGRQKMKDAYLQLLEITSRVVGQAKRFSDEIAKRVKRGNLSVMRNAKKQLGEMIPPGPAGAAPNTRAGTPRQHPGRWKAAQHI
jgi:IS5 family transposase